MQKVLNSSTHPQDDPTSTTRQSAVYRGPDGTLLALDSFQFKRKDVCAPRKKEESIPVTSEIGLGTVLIIKKLIKWTSLILVISVHQKVHLEKNKKTQNGKK